jgi:hypothetical protein
VIELRWRRVSVDVEAPGFALPADDQPQTKVVLEYRYLLPRPHGITLTPHVDEYSAWAVVAEEVSDG